MEVILLKDVPKVGKKFTVAEVAAGFARNRLIPQKFAEVATDATVKRYERLRAQHEAERQVRADLLLKNLKDLEGVTVTMTERTNDQGHLFAGIHKEELVPVIKEQTNLDVDVDHIMLDKPIKEAGDHEITIAVGDEKAVFTLSIAKADEE